MAKLFEAAVGNNKKQQPKKIKIKYLAGIFLQPIKDKEWFIDNIIKKLNNLRKEMMNKKKLGRFRHRILWTQRKIWYFTTKFLINL